jgi:hypothetical protein
MRTQRWGPIWHPGARATAVHAGLVAVDDLVGAARADTTALARHRALRARTVGRHVAPLAVRALLGTEHAATVDVGLVAVDDAVGAADADVADAVADGADLASGADLAV